MAEKAITLSETIEALMESKKYSSVRDILVTMNPADIAAMFDDMDESLLPRLFRLLPKDDAAETFVEMDSDTQELLIQGFSDSELKEVVDELYVDDAVDLVEEMPANVVKRILKQADSETRKMINEILRYPEDCAGSIMTTEFVTLRPDMDVEAAIKRIRRTGVDSETINNCYVTDDHRHLIGTISIRTIILAEEDDVIEQIMEDNVISVSTLDDQEDVAAMFTKYNFTAIPVVDGENRMVGIVTVDDAMEVIEAETTEDIELMAGATPIDKPYLKTSAFHFFVARFPWLALLMVSATFTGIILNFYEDALSRVSALTLFIPMLMGTGGNSGSQTSATVIRALSVGDLEFKDILRVIGKELLTALMCGVCMAIVTFGKIMLVDNLIMGNPAVTAGVAMTVGLTLILIILAAKFVGCVLPMLADKIGVDPAVMAAPFISTFVDALSLLAYFAVAQRVLGL